MIGEAMLDLGNGTVQLLVALCLIAFAPVLAGWVCVLLTRLAQRRKEHSPLDDSPRGPLPETWRAPCGEIVRLHSNPSDRGPKAAA